MDKIRLQKAIEDAERAISPLRLELNRILEKEKEELENAPRIWVIKEVRTPDYDVPKTPRIVGFYSSKANAEKQLIKDPYHVYSSTYSYFIAEVKLDIVKAEDYRVPPSP